MALLLLGAGFPCFAQNALPFDTAFQNVLNYLTGRITTGSTVAVLSFQSEYPNLSEYIIDDLTSGLVNTDRYTVVDRRSLEILAQEMAFQLSGEVSDETALAIGRRLGAQTVISGAISYLGEFYRLRVQAIEVETARIQGSQTVTIQPNRLLATLTGVSWTGAPEPEAPPPPAAEPEKPAKPDRPAAVSDTGLFYLGARAGASFSFYEPNQDLWPYAYSAHDVYFSGDFAAQVSVQVFKFLAIQAEAVFSAPNNDIKIMYWTNAQEIDTRAKYSVLTFPVLAKLTYRPGIFLLAAYGGGYFTLPLEALTLKDYWTDTEHSYNFAPPLGFIAGGNFGIRLGLATLFLDIRYAGDFSDFTIEGDWGSRAVFKRGRGVASMGVEFGLGKRK
jgi:TolB-like protein